MTTCYDVGINGRCGVSCPVFHDGRCEVADEISLCDVVEELGEEDAEDILWQYPQFREEIAVRQLNRLCTSIGTDAKNKGIRIPEVLAGMVWEGEATKRYVVAVVYDFCLTPGYKEEAEQETTFDGLGQVARRYLTTRKIRDAITGLHSLYTTTDPIVAGKIVTLFRRGKRVLSSE